MTHPPTAASPVVRDENGNRALASPLVLPRRDCLETPQERWRPPVFRAQETFRGRLNERLRRFLDLQYASIYRDVRGLASGMSGEVLDVGCGAQPFRHLLPVGCRYRGIDSAAAPTDFGYQIPDTTYFEGSRWPVDDNSIDYLLSTETLEHVFESAAFLAEAYRCLKPGGGIVLTVPFSARWHYIPHDYWRFTPSALQKLLTHAGFGEIHVYARGNSVTVAVYKLLGLILAASAGRGREGADFGIGRALGIISLPLLPLLAIPGQLSLFGEGGDDCLGYTIVARRPLENLPE